MDLVLWAATSSPALTFWLIQRRAVVVKIFSFDAQLSTKPEALRGNVE
jgi:hypothetical protein